MVSEIRSDRCGVGMRRLCRRQFVILTLIGLGFGSSQAAMAQGSACCLPNGACADVPEDVCVGQFSGVPQGLGTNCDATTCPCEPDITGERCNQVDCPDPNQVCRPARVVCDPNGQCRVEDCDCSFPGGCQIALDPPSSPFCIPGDCPPNTTCELVSSLLPTGFTEFKCDCIPVGDQCMPNANQTACVNPSCDIPEDRCQPSCVTFNPATGGIRVNACDCSTPNECHVGIGVVAEGPGNPCVVSDVGNGTVSLPPDGCEYLSPDEVHLIIDGLPAGTTIELAPIHRNFICKTQGGPNDCGQPGGTLGGEVELFFSDLSLNVQGTGALSTLQRDLNVPVFCETHVGPRNPGDPVQTFPTDMFRLQGQLFGDPDFCQLVVTAGTNFGLPSPGQTTLTQLPGGDFQVDSFFDITYRIDFQGCPGSVLDGMAGSTTGTVRMEASGSPVGPPCVGACPPGTTCVRDEFVNADGSIDICCSCQDQPVECGPQPDGQGCLDTICPAADEICQPTVVQCDPNGFCQVLECECRRAQECHAELSTAGGPPVVCVGGCPAGEVCFQSMDDTDGDGIDDTFKCTCEPEPEPCAPNPEGDGCNPTVCPDPNEVCVPTRVICGPGPAPCRVTECVCRNPALCHVELDPPTFPFCVGSCPNGLECVQRVIKLPTDEFLHVCECEPPTEACCLAQTDGSCQDLPRESCVEMGGQPLGVGSECQAPEPCCVIGDATSFCIETDPQCCQFMGGIAQPAGSVCSEPEACCLGTACLMVDPLCCDDFGGIPQGTGTDCSNTLCEEPDCGPTPGGFQCAPFDCPAGEQCVPTVVSCPPGAPCVILECECRDPELCHAVFTPGGPPVCQGVCPPGTDCELRVLTVPSGVLYSCECVGVDEACCLPLDVPGGFPHCVELPREECVQIGGEPLGPDTVCQEPEACCLPTPDGSAICFETDPQCCERTGGTPQGQNALCTQTVACCLPDGSCIETDRVCCDDFGGMPQEVGVSCGDDPCGAGECTPTPNGDRCTDTACDIPEDRCVPQVVECLTPNGPCRVVECECQDPNECHVDLDPPNSPFCSGACPPGFDCELRVTPFLNTFRYHCACIPPETGCCLGEGQCENLPIGVCKQKGGEPLALGDLCEPEPCCFVNQDVPFCGETDPRCCEAAGGVPQGPNLFCDEPVACCLPNDSCVEIGRICCDEFDGTPMAPGTTCDDGHCPERPFIVHALGHIGETRPCSGYIDPLCESTDGVNLDLGLTEVTLVFNVPVFAIGGGPVTTANFSATETGGAAPPTVTGVDASGNPLIVVTLDRIITLEEWTTVRASVQSAFGVPIANLGDLGNANEPDRLDIGFLPCDINQDGSCGPFDLLRFRQYVNGVLVPSCGLLLDYVDINRDGALGPFDLLHFRQLVNGVPPATQAWGGETMDHPRP